MLVFVETVAVQAEFGQIVVSLVTIGRVSRVWGGLAAAPGAWAAFLRECSLTSGLFFGWKEGHKKYLFFFFFFLFLFFTKVGNTRCLI